MTRPALERDTRFAFTSVMHGKRDDSGLIDIFAIQRKAAAGARQTSLRDSEPVPSAPSAFVRDAGTPAASFRVPSLDDIDADRRARWGMGLSAAGIFAAGLVVVAVTFLATEPSSTSATTSSASNNRATSSSQHFAQVATTLAPTANDVVAASRAKTLPASPDAGVTSRADDERAAARFPRKAKSNTKLNAVGGVKLMKVASGGVSAPLR